mgnify:CR=1 FL=1
MRGLKERSRGMSYEYIRCHTPVDTCPDGQAAALVYGRLCLSANPPTGHFRLPTALTDGHSGALPRIQGDFFTQQQKAGAGLGEFGGARAGIKRGGGAAPKGVGEPLRGAPLFLRF